MKLLPISVARDGFAQTIEAVSLNQEPVVLTWRGRPLVAIIPMQSFKRAQLLEALADGAAAAVSEIRKAWPRWSTGYATDTSG